MKNKRHLNFHHSEDKMGMHSYHKRRNASVIAFSPDFREAVKVLRSELGIPTGGFDRERANAWYKKHHAANTRERLRPRPRYYWYFPKEIVEFLDSFSYHSEPSRVNLYPDVPLDRYAMELIRRFDLPEDLVDEVKAYVLLADYGSLGTGSAVQLILVPVNEGEEGTKYVALVAGIDAATSQKDWLDTWQSVKAILRLSGINELPRKRPTDNLLLRDLTFWEEIKEGRTARETIDKWIEKHPEDVNIGEDAVRKAAGRIDKIMHSHSQKVQQDKL